MTLAPAPESSRKFSGPSDCGTVTRTQTRPSRNSNGNSPGSADSADTLQQVANTITEAIKRQNMSTRAATYVPTTAMRVNRREYRRFQRQFLQSRRRHLSLIGHRGQIRSLGRPGRHRGLRRATAVVDLNRGTLYRAVGAEDTAIAGLRLEARAAAGAVPEEQAGVGRHCFRRA